MHLQITDIMPTINNGLTDTGFFFGAGTSKDAGYPLMNDLTNDVIGNLSPLARSILDQILALEKVPSHSLPDIEIIADLIGKHIALSGASRLQKSIQRGVVKQLLRVKKPVLDTHIRFFKALKKLLSSQPTVVWIFTTNYDLLFEIAAAMVGINVNNGFEGIGLRYFAPERMDLRLGRISETSKKRQFEYFKQPAINLVKLHGSISWFKGEDAVYESTIPQFQKNQRAIVLPSGMKIMDTLESPHDRLFEYSKNALGKKCKYLVTCGYSFRDRHVNERLIVPKLKENDIKLTALLSSAPPPEMTHHSSFQCLTPNHCYKNGTSVPDKGIWKFSELTDLLANYAGIA